MPDTDWVLGDMVWTMIGAAVILGLMVLNAYFQRIGRIAEEEHRIGLLRSDPLNQQRSGASQSRQPDDI